LAVEAFSVLMDGRGHGELRLVCVYHSFHRFISLLVKQEADLYSLRSTPDVDDATCTPISTSVTPLTSIASGSKVKSEALKTPSRAGTPKPRSMLKRSLQDALADGSARENQILERLGTQKHKRAIGELELKRRKLENKALKKKHQREREHEQHEFRMMQMRMMMSQGQQAAAGMIQPQNRPSFDGFGLLDELNNASLSSESPAPGSYPM
jgi:hypothetical protein